MRYKKGMKVEILEKKEVPSGCWRPAEILSGNGRTYSVKYDPPSPGTEGLWERVPRKLVRPRPPSGCDQIDWFPGDILEVFDHSSWKIAEVLRTAGQVYFSVRLLGSSQTLALHRSDLRLRQCWENDRWVPVGKVPPFSLSLSLSLNYSVYQADFLTHFLSQDLEELPVEDERCGKGLKRGKKRGQTKRKKMPPGKKPRKNENVDFPLNRFMGPKESSVCSSSGSNDLNIGSGQDRDGHLSDDARSCCRSTTGVKKSTSTGRDVAERIHKLELYAYRTTLEALYHSGSITWEQEALMTNLRVELHISNDEHLSELRNLSSQSS